MNALFREGSKSWGGVVGGGGTLMAWSPVGKGKSVISLGLQKMIQTSWF